MYWYRFAAPPGPKESLVSMSRVSPTDAAEGVTNVADSGVKTWIGIASVAPGPISAANCVSAAKSVPCAVTVSPPTTGPYSGVIESMRGGVTVSWSIRVFQHACASVQRPSTEPSSDPDTTHTSDGFTGSSAAPE